MTTPTLPTTATPMNYRLLHNAADNSYQLLAIDDQGQEHLLPTLEHVEINSGEYKQQYIYDPDLGHLRPIGAPVPSTPAPHERQTWANQA